MGEISHEEIHMFVFFVFLYVSPHKSKLDIYNILLALPHPGPPYLGGLPVYRLPKILWSINGC